VNITYKILVNGAVAMTGGQPIEGEPLLEGAVTAPEIARQLAAEGVRRIAVVSDDVAKYDRKAFPPGATLHHRDRLDLVQRELRSHPGVSALVYDQVCAAEARRLRKRGDLPDPDRRIVINELVCEGCGDCSVQSNCISIEPVETELGRKRRINQSTCNKDYSCVKGYCPSFVSVIGGRVRRAGGGVDADVLALLAGVPEPPVAPTERPFDVLVGGIGGTGVVTVGALLGMAAHLEGKGCSTLDVTGLAQKNGPVTSHVRVADDPESLHATRIAEGRADLVLGCDIVVASGADALSRMAKDRTTAVVNTHVAPTSAFASHPDLDLSPRAMQAAIAASAEDPHFVDATRLATALLGDALAANLFLLGYALQRGRIPVGLPALHRAIELNARAVEMNQRALAWGRLAAHDLARVEAAARPALRASQAAPPALGLEELVEHRAAMLVDYQGPRLARRYRALVERVAARERERAPGREGLALAVARYYAKLLAYKDEYEVARLYTNGEFRRQLEAEFEGGYRLQLHLAPPWGLNPRDPATGRHRKWTFGAWMFPVLALLARGKLLRGTPFDPCGWTAHRRLERRLVRDYEARVEQLLAGLSPESFDLAVEIARIPELIRGFDSVKEEQLEQARAREAELLAAFRLRATAA
jgi:indolepyruvate ferredoxin oxidoreductase